MSETQTPVTSPKLKTVSDLPWSKSREYIGADGQIYHVLRSDERVRDPKDPNLVYAPGFFFVAPEGHLEGKTFEALNPVAFLSQYRPATGSDAPATPTPEDELESWSPNLDEHQELQLKNIFTYHKPTEEQQRDYVRIRAAGRHLAAVIIATTPKGADQSAAVRKVREAIMTANAAIALSGNQPKKTTEGK